MSARLRSISSIRPPLGRFGGQGARQMDLVLVHGADDLVEVANADEAVGIHGLHLAGR
jgi:hypothetical protein